MLIPRVKCVCTVCKSVASVPLAYVKEGLSRPIAERVQPFKLPTGWALITGADGGLRLVCNSTCATQSLRA